MAKFKDLNLLLQEEQRILFGDDTLSNPAVYPVTTVGTEKPFMGYTTISGYNTTLPGSGTTIIAEVDELVITVPVAGERATEDYHLVRYDQMISFTPSHGDLTGLDDDDHMHYVLVDGTRGFTGTVSGIDPTESYHLTTRWYVDDLVDTVSGTIVDQIITDHGDLTGLGGDDHVQYILHTGIRGFTGTISGIDPSESYHLTTRWYVDDQINTLSGTIYEELDNYVTLNTDQTISGSKIYEGDTIFNGGTTFNETMTVNSGINYGDSTISGTGDIYTGNIYAENQKWGRIEVLDNARDQAVVFGTAWPDDDYTVVATLTNEVDGTPSIYSTIQGVKAGTGFTTHFSGKIDSDDFVLEWHAFYGQFN